MWKHQHTKILDAQAMWIHPYIETTMWIHHTKIPNALCRFYIEMYPHCLGIRYISMLIDPHCHLCIGLYPHCLGYDEKCYFVWVVTLTE